MGLLGVSAFWGWRTFSPTGRWREKAFVELPILVVDYTVPFETYREHKGLFWLLNQHKIRPFIAPKADAPETWELARDYVGYRPLDREHPVRLAHVDRRRAEVIYVADTYGVYREDLANIATGIAHMDYTPLVFGGLSAGDAHALTDFVNRGRMVIAEFNTFCDPTQPEVRQRMEELFGVTWTEWVGRVFADPYETNDVPHWLAREFEKQYPGRSLPHSPILLLVERGGRLMVLDGPSIDDVAPRVVVTPEGHARFPAVAHDAPYYFWFSIMRERADTHVHAHLELPKLEGAAALLEAAGIPAAPPALTERAVGPGRAIYFVGDFADIDFEPGAYNREDVIAQRADSLSAFGSMTTEPAFWRFYTPVMDQLLRERIVTFAKKQAASREAAAAAH